MDLLGSVVAANPCPPLALQCIRPDPRTGRSGVGFCSSHHALMQAYMHAMRRDDARDNTTREETQTELTRVFMTAFKTVPATPAPSDEKHPTDAGWDDAPSVCVAVCVTPDPETLYNAATTFTRAYLQAFMPKRINGADARFAPYADISSDTYSDNPIVRGACEHLAGTIFYDEDGVRDFDAVLTPLKTLRFSEILTKYAEVHSARGVKESGVKESGVFDIVD